MPESTPLTPGSFDPSVGGGGGGFTPTAWVLEYYDVFLDSDPNDGAPVQIAGPITYDPKKQYCMAITNDFSLSLTKPIGTVSLTSWVPGLSGTSSAPWGVGVLTDTAQPFDILWGSDYGTWVSDKYPIIYEGATIPDPNYPVPSGITGELGPMAVDAFQSTWIGLSVNDGTFYKFFNSNGAGYDSAGLIVSRQVVA